MAYALLEPSSFVLDVPGAVYDVRPYTPWEAPPFKGPATRDWNAARLLDDDVLEFEWLTGIDRMRRAARALVAGEKTIAQLRRDVKIRRYLERLAEEKPREMTDRDAALVGHRFDERVLRILARRPKLLRDETGFGVYWCETDSYLEDAADALDLPNWAKMDLGAGGGPGSGYDQPFVVLRPPRTLADLARWLADRAARADARVRSSSPATRRRLGITARSQKGVRA